MTIKKPARKTESEISPTDTDIDRVINAGSPPPKSEDNGIADKEIKFQMVISPNLCRLIDSDRELTKTSRSCIK